MNKLYKTREEFIAKLKETNNYFNEGLFKICEDYVTLKTPIKIKCNLGCYHKITPNSLFSGARPSTRSALNKSEYWIKKAKLVHGNIYDYSKTVFKHVNEKLIVTCKVHGDFNVTAYSHLRGFHCKECYNVSERRFRSAKTTEEFIYDSKKIHKDKYDYSLTKYINNKINVKIICPKHGVIEIRPDTHLSKGYGCRFCHYDRLSKKYSEGHTSFTKSSWFEMANKSDNFDSWKVYKLICWDDATGENFYKIGRTFTKMSKRFNCKTNMPYSYKVLKIIEKRKKKSYENMEYIFNLENRFKNLYKINSYTPIKKFCGAGECFNITAI